MPSSRTTSSAATGPSELYVTESLPAPAVCGGGWFGLSCPAAGEPFDPGDISQPDDVPLGSRFHDDLLVPLRPVQAGDEHDPRGRSGPPTRINHAALRTRSHHVFPGEAVGLQPVEVQPNADRIVAVPRAPVLRVLAKVERNLRPRDRVEVVGVQRPGAAGQPD